MNKLWNWYKSRTSNEKVLLGIVVILLILIVVRWNWILKEASEGFQRFFK